MLTRNVLLANADLNSTDATWPNEVDLNSFQNIRLPENKTREPVIARTPLVLRPVAHHLIEKPVIESMIFSPGMHWSAIFARCFLNFRRLTMP